jgi:nucleoside-diphosphate-sugar epimerase
MIFITGASGFVGKALCVKLSKHHILRILVRDKKKDPLFSNVDIVEASLSSRQDWRSMLSGVSVVIHCAARDHEMRETSSDPLADFRRVNVDGTLRLAQQASEVGVRRFIFLSSIKVNGEGTQLGHPFNPDQIPAPVDPYGISKYEAEIGLKALAEETGMEVVIIRAPLVYGPGVKRNFLSMMELLQKGIPLPLGGVTKNRRSLVFLENLVDLISVCIEHPDAANQTFFVSDDKDLSTTALLRKISEALGLTANLFAVSPALISFGARIIGRADFSLRLCGSLQVDISKTKELLGWSPTVGIDEGLRLTAEYLLEMQYKKSLYD